MKNAFEYEAELVALRGELANAKEWSERLDKRCVALATDKDTLIDRCKAAEQRNAVMTKALERIIRPHDCGCVPCTGSCTSKYALEIKLEEIREIAGAALKPAESGGAQ